MADAVVIGLAKKVKRGSSSSGEGPGEDDAEDEGMSLDEAEDDAVDEMIGALTGDKPDRDTFKSALRDFVKACVAREEKGGY